MNKLPVKIICENSECLPFYATENSAGMDLKANIDGPIELRPFETRLIPTGVKIQLPEGYEAQIRPRSGLSLKRGLVAILGTIDADYRGEVGVILHNQSDIYQKILPFERIAQMIVSQVEKVQWVSVETLDSTERGEGGFGSTGR